MISGEMDPKSPEWLTQHLDAIQELGYFKVSDSDNSGDQYAKLTESVGLEYLKLFLTDQNQALTSIGGYLNRFRDINRSVGILTSTTSNQFGLIINIASLHYESMEKDRLHFLHRQIDNYLRDKNTRNIPGYTAELRKPELLRDMVAHWSAINFPVTGSYTDFLTGNIDWENVRQSIDLRENNPVLFALTIPEVSTDPLVRQRFQEHYPELSGKGLDIISAHLCNQGAHNEVLHTSGLEMANRFKRWEESIYESLKLYGDEYHTDILRLITQAAWNIFDDPELSFPALLDKMKYSTFSLDEEGKLIRGSR